MHDETWAAAVHYAVDQGTDVINMSFGNDGNRCEVSNARGGPALMAPGVEILGADPTRS
ncbi:hypothetical protein [Streptomyces chartreusis]|uniref:hypothetical protein n=1 Tax=Streptomyces chartreusis TaxID=1969 RepID=UPI002E818CBC|nr:hypothetical protein [Streptomyces chartreusis]WUB23109.1 hypothetical protein OG997_43290 [Streptomyces chartreusis]